MEMVTGFFVLWLLFTLVDFPPLYTINERNFSECSRPGGTSMQTCADDHLFKNEYFTSRAIYKGKTKANRKDKFTDLVQIYIYFLLDLCIHIWYTKNFFFFIF